MRHKENQYSRRTSLSSYQSHYSARPGSLLQLPRLLGPFQTPLLISLIVTIIVFHHFQQEIGEGSCLHFLVRQLFLSKECNNPGTAIAATNTDIADITLTNNNMTLTRWCWLSPTCDRRRPARVGGGRHVVTGWLPHTGGRTEKLCEGTAAKGTAKPLANVTQSQIQRQPSSLLLPSSRPTPSSSSPVQQSTDSSDLSLVSHLAPSDTGTVDFV